MISVFFFFNDTATTEIYTLSLHDALPICRGGHGGREGSVGERGRTRRDQVPSGALLGRGADRKSTRLNSSHSQISYAVFCLKKKKNTACLRYGVCARMEHAIYIVRCIACV